MLGIEEIKGKLMSYCAYQERCEHDVRKKMEKWPFLTDQLQNELLQALRNDKFLDDSRYVESYVRGKVYIKKWGKHKIRHHLRQKRIIEQHINQVLNEIDQEVYSQNLLQAFTSKWLNLNHKKDKATKQKIGLYLQQKGYEFEEINAIIKRHFDS